jgi:hypothetical protein
VERTHKVTNRAELLFFVRNAQIAFAESVVCTFSCDKPDRMTVDCASCLLSASFFFASWRRAARRGGRFVWHALRMLFSVLSSKIAFLPFTCNSGANSAAQNVFWSVTAYLAVTLHKPSRTELSQNRYYGVQAPRKLTRTIRASDKRSRPANPESCFKFTLYHNVFHNPIETANGRHQKSSK